MISSHDAVSYLIPPSLLRRTANRSDDIVGAHLTTPNIGHLAELLT